MRAKTPEVLLILLRISTIQTGLLSSIELVLVFLDIEVSFAILQRIHINMPAAKKIV